MFGCLSLFLQVGQMELEAFLPTALPYLSKEEMGLDERCFHPVSAVQSAERGLAATFITSEYTLFFCCSSTKKPLGNLVQRLS